MVEATALLAAALLLGFGARRIMTALYAGADPVHGYLCGFAFCMGASLVVLAPANLTRLAHLVPQTAAVLAGDALKTASLSFLMLFALSLSSEPENPGRNRVRRHLVTAWAVQLTSAALLLAARPGWSGGAAVLHDTAGRLLMAGYDALFTGYALWCLAVLGRVLVRHLRSAGRGLPRIGLRLALAAVAAGTLWTLWSLDDIVAVLTRGTQDGGEDTLSNVLGMICVALAVAAATVTLWSTRLAAPLRWLRAYRSYRDLEPLWAALHAQFPEIALPLAEPGGRLPLWQAEFALYRRIIEIRDGQLALRPYADPAAGTWAPTDAQREAEVLATALDNHRHGRRRTADAEAVPGLSPVPGTVEAEAAWLTQVARAFLRTRPDVLAPSPATPPRR
ncbi:MAB_1171c family putative transporter [Streptomyces camelliae]|uniref:DUF6545 domain-containing protein n=1 Tax=Streptomyces camelliae TaxID=3004093 RepID=A0ABY7PDI3_9ACTN|nr:MAB_1171c family putative transporter [Streptomyces sp. HUAS 2-6]WBO68679.1 hypothetical protein O1G22_40670 [Streptomyces sp. HUAS 2-6]